MLFTDNDNSTFIHITVSTTNKEYNIVLAFTTSFAFCSFSARITSKSNTTLAPAYTPYGLPYVQNIISRTFPLSCSLCITIQLREYSK